MIVRPCFRARTMVAALALVALHGAPAGGAEDYEPKRCTSAVTYIGPSLHAPLDTTLFAGLDGAMTGALDDSLVARWFPDLPNVGAITVDHLLTHTSGAFSFNADLKFRRKKGYTPPDELIRIAARHGNALCPGERWSYSNTGYVLLARIVERIEGLPFHAVVTRRIIDRLGLRGIIALAPEQTPAGLATGHVAGKPDLDFDSSMPFGAGIIVAPADDMVRFWQALLAGRLVGAPSLRHAFEHLYPMYDPGTFYGRGVMVIEFKDGERPPNVWLGHGGGTPSAKAVIAYDTASRVFIAVAINGDVSSEAAAYRLLNEVRSFRASR